MVLNRAFMEHARDTPLKRFISWLSPSLMIRVMNTVFIPGMTEHFLFRKRWVEERVNSAIAGGVRQVIVLGGGFDTLALRMAEQHPNLVFFEIDLLTTQIAKTRVLKEINYPIPANCVFRAVDLSQDGLATTLHSDQRFQADASTLIVLEGVLMYLSEEEVAALFSSIKTLLTGALTTVFGAIAAPDEEGGLMLRLTNGLLKRSSEGTKWYCPMPAMPEFMSRLGYAITEHISYKNLQRLYRKEDEISQAPEEDENYYVAIKNL